MPGEERPSLTSVTPYDDDPEVLVNKVEELCAQARVEKERKASKNAKQAKNFDNLVDKFKDEQIDIMNTNKVKNNGGKQLDRANFVKTDLKKTGKYKPALRGAAFTNKI
jgi:hypothetical protein